MLAGPAAHSVDRCRSTELVWSCYSEDLLEYQDDTGYVRFSVRLEIGSVRRQKGGHLRGVHADAGLGEFGLIFVAKLRLIWSAGRATRFVARVFSDWAYWHGLQYGGLIDRRCEPRRTLERGRGR